ncbi:MAG: antitoxin VapB family protein [Candidatus Lokiarchaeota archaeon]|nr:antitoxin VapB family protein [Candidatus Lokiarchaeota archaeon]
MGSKTITISEKAYRTLKREKLEHESFSDVIIRLTKRFGKIMESFGKWEMSDEEEKKMKKDLNEAWDSWSKDFDQMEKNR